jgi:ABC-type amino acid transport substrate-binding protein
VRRGELELKSAIDGALTNLYQSGELQEAFARWNIPFNSTLEIETPSSGE